jgi:carboxymethylenebutenolidase
MDQRFIDLYDEFTHASLDRRAFLERLATMAGGMGAAMAILPLLQANKAAAAQIEPNDSRLSTETITYPGATGDMRGYLVKPKDARTPLPGVVVIHENRGLTPHIQDVARRVALAGFVALAPDFLSPSGGTPDDEDAARQAIGKLEREPTVANAVASVKALRDRPDTTDRIGAVGFCWGGGMIGRLAVADPTLNAGVVYYGPPPPTEQVANIKAALLLHYAGQDERINANVPAFKEALDKAGVKYTVHMYEGKQHAFNNDTSAARYDAEAAKLAWDRTIEFFEKTLSG